MPKVHGGIPLAWDDSMAPAFSVGSGAAAPSYTTDFIAAADCGPSMMFVCSLKLKSSSTVDASIVSLLSFDIHYQKGQVGTDGEYS